MYIVTIAIIFIACIIQYIIMTTSLPFINLKSKGWILLWVALSFVQCRTQKPASTLPTTVSLSRIDSFMSEAVDSGWIVGGLAFIQKDNKVIYNKAFGYSDKASQKKMQTTDIFRIASQTKAITSVAIMMLYDEGKLSLTDPVSRFIPAFSHQSVINTYNKADSSFTTVPAKRDITIKDLLTHTSGLDYAIIGSDNMRAVYAKAGLLPGFGSDTMHLDNMVNLLAKMPLAHQPGEKFTYSLGIDVLGRIVELVSGMPLDRFFKTRLLDPLGMTDTYFYLPKEKQARLIKAYTVDSSNKIVEWKNVINGLGPDYPKQNGTYFAGGAGLSSTITDYTKFLQMLLNGGTYNGHRFLKESTVQMMTTNQIDTLSLGKYKFGLGFRITTPEAEGETGQSAGSYAWGGFFGTMYWVDPKEHLIGEMYMQQSPLQKNDLHDQFIKLVYAH